MSSGGDFSVFETSTQTAAKSDAIDNFPSTAVWFTIASRQPCIEISIEQAGEKTESTGLPAYFIVEKLLNVSQFGVKNNSTTYLCVGQNFNSSWQIQSPVSICENGFNGDAVYRIRFTAFDKNMSSFKIKISGKAKFFSDEKSAQAKPI